jgi:hypothetical protein
MSKFSIYFQLGLDHIFNRGAIDHILFMVALTLRYQFSDWKKLLVFVTAFTLGHTITLTLCVFNILQFSGVWVEFLIAATIVVTAFSNLFVKKFVYKNRFPAIYFFALFFGLIHGLGFSTNLKSILGNDSGVWIKILAANLGIEVAQIVFVVGVLLIGLICLSLLKVNRREYILFLSGAIFGIALQMAIERFEIILKQTANEKTVTASVSSQHFG